MGAPKAADCVAMGRSHGGDGEAASMQNPRTAASVDTLTAWSGAAPVLSARSRRVLLEARSALRSAAAFPCDGASMDFSADQQPMRPSEDGSFVSRNRDGYGRCGIPLQRPPCERFRTFVARDGALCHDPR